MKEHVIVFDDPQKFGKEKPSLYDIQIFNVPEGSKGRIVTLLKRLKFESIREVKEYDKVDSGIETVNADNKICIMAEYFVGEEKNEYEKFWNKKEIIELALNNQKKKEYSNF